MNKVEKMYENANVKSDCTYLFLVDGNGKNEAARTVSIGSKVDLKRLIIDCGVKGKVIKSTNTLKPFYPPFTAEKQLELIKWLSTKELKIRTNKQPYAIYVGILGNDNTCFYGCEGLYLEQTLAELINSLWQDLTEEEKQQVKGILE